MIEDNPYFKVVDAEFPRIGQKIKLFWGHPEFVRLMQDLQHDLGDRPRAGFPPEILFALHELETDHDLIYPHLAGKNSGIWGI